MNRTVVIDGEITMRNTIDGEITMGNTIDGSAYEILKVDEGTRDYERLNNKPQIETVTLIGNKTFEELGLSPINGDEIISILSD